MAYLPLSTANLPDPAIDPAQGSSPADYFGIDTYSGTGTTQERSALQFQPDWTWIKERSSTSSHHIFDAIRGATKLLKSDTTQAELTSGTSLTSFDSDGFTLGGSGAVNESGQTYVAWNWKANGSGVSNTDGSITSTVSANTESGFSIVSWTANGTNDTLGHGLVQTPEMVIVKPRSTTGNWVIATTAIDGGMDRLWLNLTSASVAETTQAFTSSTITSWNYSNNTTMIAYCFHSVEGFSKFGSYTGNGSADGPFVYTGFRPAFVMVKVASAAGERWQIHDTSREAYNGAIAAQFADGALVDNTTSTYAFDILSNGFKPRTSHEGSNYSGQTIIYMAFAENPFKYSNAR